MADWSNIFADYSETSDPATDSDIESLHSEVLAPLSDSELTALDDQWDCEITERELTPHPFSSEYTDFLRWSNGGTFQNGDRSFDMFAVSEIRQYLLGYGVAAFMQYAIPFAFDGGGSFYLFDMRNPPVDGEYPIVFNHCSELDWEESIAVGTSFLDVCKCSIRPCDLEP